MTLVEYDAPSDTLILLVRPDAEVVRIASYFDGELRFGFNATGQTVWIEVLRPNEILGSVPTSATAGRGAHRRR